MAVSMHINLPRSHDAQFPDRCVVCGRREPNSHVRVITASIGLADLDVMVVRQAIRR
jgi:hypothetical protein